MVYIYIFSFVVGLSSSVPALDEFCDDLRYMAFAESMHKNMQSHLRLFLQFCSCFKFSSFPLIAQVVSRYVAYLSHMGQRCGTIQNHLSSLKHFHQSYGFYLGSEHDYFFKLTLWGAKRFLGVQTIRKLAITPFMLYTMASYFDFNNSMQAAMWALFLVAFFSFLRESNLVVDSKAFSPKVLHHRDLIFTPHGLHYLFTK